MTKPSISPRRRTWRWGVSPVHPLTPSPSSSIASHDGSATQSSGGHRRRECKRGRVKGTLYLITDRIKYSVPVSPPRQVFAIHSSNHSAQQNLQTRLGRRTKTASAYPGDKKMLTKSIIRLCLSALFLQGALAATDNGSCNGTPQQFVQAFYDWYMPVVLHRHSGPAWGIAIRQRGRLFDEPLKAALNQDALAQARSPDVIVGLDTDPFVDSQDPPRHYAVAGVISQKNGFLVQVKSWGETALDVGPAINVELACKKHSWKLRNFRYKHDDLLSILARLRSARDGHRR